MSTAWVYQKVDQVQKLGPDKASWYVGWFEPDGRKKGKSFGPGPQGKKNAEKYRRKVEAELMKRGLGRPASNNPGHLTPDTGSGGDIHTSKFQSYHTPDPFGWDLQISNITFETRGNT